MEQQPGEDVQQFAAAPHDSNGPGSKSNPTGSADSPGSGPRTSPDISPQRSPCCSSKTSPSDESRPRGSSPTSSSSPFRNTSLGALSNSQKSQGSPHSQKTTDVDAEDEDGKPRRCVGCNPVHVCLILGIAVALGSVAMTVCGYFSKEIAMSTIMIGNETISMMDEELQGQIEKFRTFGPVLIGLGSFISMCACVLICEARDEKRKEAQKLLVEEQEDQDYVTRQEHMYALHREVMDCAARHKSCPLYHEHLASTLRTKQHDDVAYADESSHSSPVVLVHGPSLAEEKQRNDSQESNESEAAKAALLRDLPRIETTDAPDAASIPTCSKYVGPEAEVETSFTASPRTPRKGILASTPPLKTKNSKPARPSNLPPIKPRSVNGPIPFQPVPPAAECVCLCGEMEPVHVPPKGGKARMKRGSRKKRDMNFENKTTGSDSGSAKSVPILTRSVAIGSDLDATKPVPRYSKSVATQNLDLVTHVNPLHDIPLDSYPDKAPHRTPPTDGTKHKTTTGASAADLSKGTSPLAPVEHPREERGGSSRTQRPRQNKGQAADPSDSPVWTKQRPGDSPGNNNNIELGASEKTHPVVNVDGALGNPVPDRLISRGSSEPMCDSNSNVSSLSSMQLSPKATPSRSNATYDVIHDKSSKGGVVL